MAKDPPVHDEKPASAGGAERGARQNADFARTNEDDGLESEREALKKAREADAPDFSSDAAADGYGNLHFGEQNLDETIKEGGPAHDGFADDVNAVAPALTERGPAAPAALAGVDGRDIDSGEDSMGGLETGAGGETRSRGREDAAPSDSAPAPASGLTLSKGGAASSQELPVPSARGGARGGEPANDHEAPVNEAPTGITLTADSAAENAPGAVIASLSAIDPDVDDTAVFTIASDESGLFEIAGGELKLKDGAAFDFEAQDSYVITLRVTDSAGNVFDKTVTINVTDVNEAPGGLNLTGGAFAENAQGALVATLSASDPDAGDSLTFSIADDQSGLFEVVGDQLKLKAGAAADFEQQTSYELTLRATDSAGNSVERTVTVNVADVNEAPTNIALSGLSVAENDAGAVIGSLSASDADFADSASFSIADDASGLFEVVGDELRLKPDASFDYEAQQSYDLTLRVTDGAGNSFEKTVSINVGDVNEAPTDIVLSGSGAAENQAGAVVAMLSAVDPDAGDNASFAIADDASGLFEVVGDELRLKPGVSLDHEAQDAYDLTLRATDSAGNSVDKTVTINVTDVNEAPTDIVLSGFTAAENDAGAVIGTLSAIDVDFADSASFAIANDASGLFEVVGDELRLKPGVSLDHEAQDAYDLTLRVTDGAGNSFEKTVTVNVADVNEAPTDITLSGSSVAENDAGATVAMLSAIDPDFADSASFAIASDASGLFEVVGDELRLKPGVSLDHEAQDSYDLTLRATDSAGNTVEKTVTVNATDVNEAPGAVSLSSTGIMENVDGAVVGALSAVDPDAGDAVAYTVSDDRFEIVGDQLKLKAGVSFDYESAAPIDVTVTATDSGGLTSEQTFTLTVEDANEAPALGFASSPGLKASYYNVGHSLSDLDQVDFNAAPDAEGVVGSLNYMQGQELFWEGGPADYFAAKYEGQIVVENGGTYTFSMASDDGSMLFIDGVAVIDNDGLHGTSTRTATVDLDAGAHEIEVRYFENGGSQTLRLQWSGPDTGGATQIIGGDAYRHGYTADTLSAPEDTPGAVIAELTVSDPDAGDAHFFTVSDDRFEVVNEDGAWLLKLKDGETLDYEAESSVDLTVTVTDSGGASSAMNVSVAVEDVNAAPQIALIGGEGLKASYYNIGHSLGDLDQIDFNAAPDAEGVVDSLNYTQGQQAFWDGAPGDYFAAKYEGQIIVGEGGTYTFSMASDDGSMLFIDGVAVIDNDGLHSTRTQTVTLDLDSGAHDIEVRYFENGGEAMLQLAWSGPDTGGVNEVIGGEAYRLPGVTDADRLGVTENVAGDHAALLSVADPDGDPVTLTVSDDRFEIVEGESGYVLKLKDGASVNHEQESEIHVTVTVTDSHGESTSESFDIPVADISEVPTGFTVSPVSSTGVLSLNLDGGNNDAAVAADMAGFPTDALTVEVAFSSTQADVGNGMPLFSYAASNGSDNEALLFLEGSSGKLHVFLAGTKINTGIANASLLDGEPHQVSFTWDQASNELKVYVDGAPAYETSVNIRDLKAGGSLVFGQEQDSERGGYNAGQTFKGEISEVRIFDYARSAGEIVGHAGGPIGNPDTEPGLVNNWVMNAEHGGAVEDLVGADNLVLQNGAYVEPGEAFDVPTVIENQPGAIAGVLSATDPDNGGPVTEFVIVNDPSGAFEIVGDQVKLKDGVSLNHETAASYDITVAAIGASGDAAEMTFAVAVADLDESPVNFALEAVSTPFALALNMDGGVDDAALAANLEGFPTDALTVEVSFASDQTDVGAGAPLFSYAASDGSDNEVLLFLEGASGKLVVYLAGQSVNTGISNASLLDGERHQVSVSWDQASNEFKVYVDGESAFETSVNIRDLKTGGSVAFGQEQDSEGGAFDTGQTFEGEIYEARIFDYARTPEEIAANSGGPVSDPGTEPGLLNNWVMASAPGGVIEDLAGADDLHLVNGAEVAMSVLSDAPMVAENDPGAVIGTLSAIDPETGGAVTQFVIADDPSGAFEIVGDQLKLKDSVAFDYESQQTHEVTINAVGAGGETTQMTFMITVGDLDDANMAPTDITLSGTSIAENDAGATVATLSAVDPDAGDSASFAIADDASGLFEVVGDELRLKPGLSLDHEAQDAYDLTLRVTDGAGNAYDKTVTINVTDVNEAPTDITLTPAASNRPVDSEVVNASFTTPDGGGSGSATVNFAGAAAGSAVVTLAFATVDNSFELFVNGESLTGETVQLQSNVYNPATQTFLQFADGTAISQPWTASASGAPRIIVQITESGVEVLALRTANSTEYETMSLVDGAFSAPGFIDGDNVVTVANANDDGPDGINVTISAQFGEPLDGPLEGVDGAVIGSLSGQDPDAGDALSFSIADDPSGLFEIVGDQLKVKDGMSLDYDSEASHQIVVEATDSHGATYQETLTVNVQDANPDAENPVVPGETIYGTSHTDHIIGTDGNDLIYAGGGNDHVDGGAGDDVIYGEAGKDRLEGGEGDDTLSGGAGKDEMHGGDGSDMFLYAMGDGSDHIEGGAGWTDVIQLQDGATPLGEFGTDWTVELTQGSIVSSDEHGVIFSQDSDGAITLSDGSVITFNDIEEIAY